MRVVAPAQEDEVEMDEFPVEGVRAWWGGSALAACDCLQHVSWLSAGWDCAVWERGDWQEDGGSTQEPPLQ